MSISRGWEVIRFDDIITALDLPCELVKFLGTTQADTPPLGGDGNETRLMVSRCYEPWSVMSRMFDGI
jgi:hypothetical protein